jgi:ankyrin repeat protein
MFIRRKDNEETHPRLYALRMLARAGAEANAQDGRGMTPLHELVLSRYPMEKWLRVAAARILLEAGANVDIADANGRTVQDIVQTREVAGLKNLLRWYGSNVGLDSVLDPMRQIYICLLST